MTSTKITLACRWLAASRHVQSSDIQTVENNFICMESPHDNWALKCDYFSCAPKETHLMHIYGNDNAASKLRNSFHLHYSTHHITVSLNELVAELLCVPGVFLTVTTTGIKSVLYFAHYYVLYDYVRYIYIKKINILKALIYIAWKCFIDIVRCSDSYRNSFLCAFCNIFLFPNMSQ